MSGWPVPDTGWPDHLRGFEARGWCWQDVDTAVLAVDDVSANRLGLLRFPRSPDPPPETVARLEHDFRAASLAPEQWIVPARSFRKLGGDVHGVLFEDVGARPVVLDALDAPGRVADALDLADRLLEALAGLHASGIVHGGLAPANVWVEDAGGPVRLFDLSAAVSPRLPVPPAVGLDARYAAPERLAGSAADIRADFFAFGAILAEWLGADAPAELRPLLDRLLHRDPAQRYGDHQLLRRDLAAFATRGLVLPATFSKPDMNYYGREREQRTLALCFERACDGIAEFALVAGPAGIGKTSLLSRLQTRVLAAGGLFALGKADQYKRGVPYSVFVHAFGKLVAGILGGPEADFALWKARLSAALGINSQVIAELIPDLRHIIGPSPPLQELAPVEAHNRFFQVFRRFVRAFAAPNHPLCFALEDLHWADPASFDLLYELVSDPEAEYLLCVGTYRDSEVGVDHPLASVLQCIPGATRLVLAGLTELECSRIIADALERTETEVRDLAAFVSRTSAGNPFHLNQTLRALQDRRLIAFDHGSGEWAWNIADVLEHGAADSVLDLLRDRLQGLPPRTQHTLIVAACLGADVDVGRLAQATGRNAAAAAVDLDRAAEHGLVLPTGMAYRFVHDRVQQAAFSLLRPVRVPGFRLRLGRRLLRALSQNELDCVLAEVVQNLNCGMTLIHDPEERRRLAVLNLAAARKARASVAHAEAVTYLRIGLAVLDPGVWDAGDRLAFELHRESFESEYQTGHFEQAERLFSLLLTKAASPVDQAMIYRTKILLDTNLRRYEEALAVATVALGLLGVRFPRRVRKAHVLAEIARAKLLMLGRSPAALAELPAMSHPNFVAASEILFAVSPAAYFLSPEAVLLSGMKIATMSMRYGNTPASAGGYVLYGLALATAFGDLKGAEAFGKLSVALGDRFGDIAIRCRVMLIYGGFVSPWHLHFDESLRLVRDSHAVSLSAGNLLYANYAILQLIFISFARGAWLGAVAEECCRHRDFVLGTQDSFGIENVQNWFQSVLALQGRTASPMSLSGEGFSEDEAEARYRAKSNLTTLGYYLIRKLHLCYLFGDLDAALRLGIESEAFIELLPGQVMLAEQALYFGLTLAGMRAAERRRPGRQYLARCRRRLSKWASSRPENFAAMHLLLEAEVTTGVRRTAPALELYDRAVASAREHGLRHIEALAAERAAAYCRRCGFGRAASAYLADAIEAYQDWGASAKVLALRGEAYGSVPQQAPPVKVADESGLALFPLDRPTTALTVAEILLDFVARARQNLAAERCAVVLRESGQPAVRLRGSDDVFESLDEPAEQSDNVSPSVVSFVLRSEREVVIENVMLDERFAACPHFRTDRFRSIVCLPLLHLGRPIGLLYMENRDGAIDPAAVRTLRQLCAEMAQTIDTARMFGSLRQSRRMLLRATRTAENLAQIKSHFERFVPASVRQLISVDPEAPDLTPRERDVTVMFLDVEGYTALCERHEPVVIKEMLERHFSRYLLHVQEHDGDLSQVEGDGMVLVFKRGGTHVRQAIEAALAIQQTAAALNAERDSGTPALTINMGVNTGTALVGATQIDGASGPFWVYGANGSVVNLAARICDFASNGEILVSNTTAERAGKAFEFEPRGSYAFKNVGSATTLLRVRVIRSIHPMTTIQQNT